MNRLLDKNDDYEEILVDERREIVYKNGEYVLGLPEPEEVVQDE